jgi:hypothetical protein
MLAYPEELKSYEAAGYPPPSNQDLEVEWMVKLGMLAADTEEAEAYLNVGAVYRIPLIRERCAAKAIAAGKPAGFGTQYMDEVLAALTPQEIEGLRQYVKANPEK